MRASLLIAALAVLCCLTACSPPPDPVTSGQLCAPADTSPQTSCASATTLTRGTASGRNAIDYRLINPTDEIIRVIIQAGPAAIFEDTTSFEMGTTDSDAPITMAPPLETVSEFYTRREQVLAPDSSVTGSLLPSELGREGRLRLDVTCVPVDACEVVLEYVLIVDPVECTGREDCPGGWECDGDRGQCVECFVERQEEMCEDEQTCELGRCVPPQPSSCAVVAPRLGAPPPDGPLTLIWLMLIAACIGARATRRRGRAGRLPILACASIIGASVWIGDGAQAQAAGPRAELTVGASGRLFTGQLGARTRRGVGLRAGQALRWRWFGAAISLSAATFLTLPDEQGSAPPFLRSLFTYSVEIGPRGYIPIWRELEVGLGANYERLGLAANSLIDITGEELGYHGASATAHVRYRWSLLVADIGGAYHWYPTLDGDQVSVTLSVGITGF